MNITNANLKPYLTKVEQILQTLVDSNVSIAIRQTRIQDAKINLEKIADHLIKSKDKATDTVFKAEIDFIVYAALQGFERVATALFSETNNALPDPGVSKSAQYLKELEENEPNENSGYSSTGDPFKDTLNTMIANSMASQATALFGQGQAPTVTTETPPSVSPVERHFTPFSEHQVAGPEVSTGTNDISGWNENSKEGFFVFLPDKGPIFLANVDELRTFLTDFIGKRLPLIVRGVRIQPKLQVTLDL